jgi:ANTAR domain-containing protein/GAF domain-containing protein
VAREPGPVTRALLEIHRDGTDSRELARHICAACVAGLDVDGAAMSLLTGSVHRETLSATDATAEILEDLQFTLGEGACLQAASTGSPVLVPDIHDLSHSARWPVFAAAVVEQTDVRALFALPLQLGTVNVGVLDLYRDSPGPLLGHELRDMVAATDTAMLLLLESHSGTEPDDEPVRAGTPRQDGRREKSPWIDRAEVHQATGMVLAQLDIPPEDAFARLRAHAFAQRRPLSDVARDVVARRLVFTEDMD